jgi:hypothetical protein
MDGQQWTRVDHRVDDQKFRYPMGNAVENVATFSIAHPVECRFIRLFQEDLNHNNNHHLSFTAVEFFGTLFE